MQLQPQELLCLVLEVTLVPMAKPHTARIEQAAINFFARSKLTINLLQRFDFPWFLLGFGASTGFKKFKTKVVLLDGRFCSED